MKTRYLLLLPALLLLLPAFKKQDSRFATAEAMAKAVLDALKANDVNRYLQLYPTMEEAREAFVTTAQTPESKKRFEQRIAENFAGNNASARDMFSKTYSSAVMLGLDWNTAVFNRIETTATEDRGNGVELTRITIIASFNGRPFRIRLRDAFKTSKGWTCGMSLHWGDMYAPQQQKLTDSMRKADSVHKADSIMMEQAMQQMRRDSLELANRAAMRQLKLDSINRANEAAQHKHGKGKRPQ